MTSFYLFILVQGCVCLTMLGLQQRPTNINEKSLYFPGDTVAPDESIVSNIGTVGDREIAPRQWEIDHPSNKTPVISEQNNQHVTLRRSRLLSRLLGQRGIMRANE